MIKNPIPQIEYDNIEEIIKGKTDIGKELWNTILSQHPADIASWIDQISKPQGIAIIKKLPDIVSSEVFQELSEPTQSEILINIPSEKASAILQNMPVDEVTDLLEYMPDDIAKKYLKLLQSKQRKKVISLLNFNPQSAGGIMNSDILTLENTFTIKKSIGLLQKIKPRLEHIERIYITDKNDIALGHIHLDDLVLNKPDTPLKDISHKNELIINVHEDQEEVAKQIKHYGLISAPVVDEHNHFLGVITADDIFDIVEEEASEDVYKISGISPIKQSYFQTPFWTMIWQRSPWLISLLLLQSISGLIMNKYNTVLDDNLVLAFFLTMLIGTGGNAGNQTGALVIRGLATGELKPENGLRILLREFSISIAMALILSVIAFIRVFITHADLLIAFAISLPLFLIIIVSMLMGALLPLGLEALNFDPAHSAQPFLATLMDIIGVLIYLVVASKILGY